MPSLGADAGSYRTDVDVVYGVLGEDLIMVLSEDLPRWAGLRGALGAETWGEFRSEVEAAEPGLYEELVEHLDEEDRPEADEPFDAESFLDLRDYAWPPGFTHEPPWAPPDVLELGEWVTT